MRLTLSDVSLEQRIRAARELIHAERGLSALDRGELLSVALWPPPVTIPREPRNRRSWDAAIRAAAIADYQGGGDSYQRVAARHGVPTPTLKDWVRRAG